MKILRGEPYPFGATWDGAGTNFAVFSEHATAVELCLFDSPSQEAESARISLPQCANGVWHGYLPNAGPGQLYGYRVSGPYEPHHGHRFNPHKLLLDPCAKAVGRGLEWRDEVYGYQLGDPGGDLSFDERDSSPYAPLGAVIDTNFPWGGDRPPRVPLRDSLICELHVKGFTQRHPDVPDELRGKYGGVCSEPAIGHLKSLGVTAVELMPVHYHLDEHALVRRGLLNYWGYNTLAYFAPDARYARDPSPASVVREFKEMVQALHRAGLEVILDVVYNHTAEGSELGPTIGMRGIDNAVYYRLAEHDRRLCTDYTGCGNTVDTRHPRVLQFIMDSLRYWVLDMHVDGFRFDLATALGRGTHEFDRQSSFFAVLQQDPVLSQVKLIAEPWDLGEGGYQVGNFSPGWSEWNGRYRDDIRRVWKGEGSVSALATRLAGSSDLFRHRRRSPQAGISLITAHDGFTLNDLVSYSHKHNEANGQDNRDGESHNNSWNCGAEGPTDDPAVLALRERQKRNLLATLMLSQGVPLLLSGDEISRTQSGNNNAYCHDNELTWLDWNLTPEKTDLLEFTRYVANLRRQNLVLRRSRFFTGQKIQGLDVRDVEWYHPGGKELTDLDWSNPNLHCLGVRLAGEAADAPDTPDDSPPACSMFLLFNTSDHAILFTLPRKDRGERWVRLLDTADPKWRQRVIPRGKAYRLRERSVAVFQLIRKQRRRQ